MSATRKLIANVRETAFIADTPKRGCAGTVRIPEAATECA